MLTTIEVVASVSAIIGSIYLLMFLMSMIIPSMKAKWKRYIVRALLFYGVVALLTVFAIMFKLPI